ncbi:cell division cycle protein 16 homolog [Phlebotomus argentipes]|uniref:cell division cycle protein 16 homolog n=1 Tax=Phlebotomus argentipes TaxID=94469 RepID=UPI002892B21C|nr:cell division cycle protein 16 homolog [Phlebotomus argentipes]
MDTSAELKDVSDEAVVEINKYRKMITDFINLRRYQTALFWAEKVAVMSKYETMDVYWYAQCLFLLEEYHRAAFVLRLHKLENKDLMCHCLVLESLYKAREFQEAIDIVNSIDSYYIMQSNDDSIDRNEIMSAITLLKGKILEALDKRSLATESYVQALQTSVYCSEALDCLTQHEMLLASEERSLMDSLPIEEQCSEADGKIVKVLYESKLKKYYDKINAHFLPGRLITSNLSILQSFRKNKKDTSSTPFSFTKTTESIRNPQALLQITKATPLTSKLSQGKTSAKAEKERLQHKFFDTQQLPLKECLAQLMQSIDMLVAKAERSFYNCNYNHCLKILDEIFKRDPFHTQSLSIQIGCLYEQKAINKLFYVAHKLVDLYPEQAISWYAVGSYYDLIGKSDSARRYLSKATTLDRFYSPAWLAYGHSFAKENEHDQAMAAYFKATQLMRGCHLPLLYIGVECGLTKNLELAENFFEQALAIAPMDVSVLHELAVIKYEYEFFKNAEEVFRVTLDVVKRLAEWNNEVFSARWEPLLNNLGHCCRVNKKYAEALEFHQQALVLRPQNAATYTAIGFVQAIMGNLVEAIEAFHKSLALRRNEIFTTTILKYVIEEFMEESLVTEVYSDTSKIVDDKSPLATPLFATEDPTRQESTENANSQSTVFENFDISMDD